MKTLVTGAGGFTGKHLVAYLLECGHQVVALDYPAHNLHGLAGVPGVIVLQQDLTAKDLTPLKDILHVHRPDWVFHLAAIISRDSIAEIQERMFRVNVLGTLRLLEMIRSTSLDPLILVPGSSAQYGEVPTLEQPILETTPLRPTTIYAASKIAQEMIALHFYRTYGLRVLCSRAFNLTGPGERPDFVCSAFARQIAQVEAGHHAPVVQVGNLMGKRDFLDVRDAVRAYTLLLRHGVPGEVYNVASGRPVSIQRILDILITFTRCKVEIKQDPTRMQIGDVTTQCGNWAKLRLATGWEPTISLQQTLRDLLDDWRRRVAMGGQS